MTPGARRAAVALAALLVVSSAGALALICASSAAAQADKAAPRTASKKRKKRAHHKRRPKRARAEEGGPAPTPRLITVNPYVEQAETESSDVMTFELEPEPEPEAAPRPATPGAEVAPEPAPTLAILRAVRTAHAPSIDGVLDDPQWSAAPVASGFTQKAPRGGEAANEQTSLRVLYDDDALYVAFDCEQAKTPVIALLARRDRPLETDSITIALDTRGAGRSAFEFTVSAAGTLIDGIRYDDGRIAREWDEIWEASSALHPGGWSAELRIPLRALRFEETADAVWGLQARRYISSLQESDEWAYTSGNAGGVVSHFGRLEGLHGIEPDHSFALRPFVLAQARHQEPDPRIVAEGWELRPSAGLDFSWHPADNVALDGTINPDFGQVEADRLILNLSTVELRFPEKRPFFLAGMDDFATLAPIFYSRRIGRTPKPPPLLSGQTATERLYDRPRPSPVYGALKLAGDLSAHALIAALSAVTGPNEVDVVLADGRRDGRLIDPMTTYNAVRVRSALASGLDFGVLATTVNRIEPDDWWPTWITTDDYYPAQPAQDGETPTLERCPQGERPAIIDRCFHDAYVASADLTWRSPGGDYALRAQGYGSAIADGPARTLPDGTLIGSGDPGAGGTLRLSKQGGDHWLLDGSLTAHGRKLDFNDLGYMERQNDLRAGVYVEYRTLDPWAVLLETHTSVLGYGENNLDGLALGRGVILMENLVLDGGWVVTIGGQAAAARFDDREVGDGTALERAAVLGAFQSVSTDPRLPFVLAAQSAQDHLENGASFSAQLDAFWRPASMVELQVTPEYSDNSGEPRYAGAGAAPEDLVFGRLHARSAGVTVRASYAFSPTLTLQSYAQLFLASGFYDDYRRFTAPAAGPRPVVHLQDLQPGQAPALLPDFERASLAVNVVLRWEYHLGSTLYLLYARSQDPEAVLRPGRVPRLAPERIGSAPAVDVLMLKLAYWIG